MLLSSGPSDSTSQNKALDGFLQRSRNIVLSWFRIVFLMLRRNKRFVVIYFANDRKNIVLYLISIVSCSKYATRSNIIGRCRKIDDEIPRKKVIILKRYKDVGKRCGGITNISNSLELTKYFSNTFVNRRWVTIFFCIYTCIVSLIINDK